jgi:hypothetical protein
LRIHGRRAPNVCKEFAQIQNNRFSSPSGAHLDRWQQWILGSRAREEQNMITERKRLAALFVDKSSQQWVVRDPEGNFWIVPPIENPWD